MKKITWATMIPLAGGFPLGAEEAIGHPPDYIITWDVFKQNDSHYINYMKKKYNYADDKIINLDHTSKLPRLDLIVSTPPCAGLSMLNSSKGNGGRGADAPQNDWMKTVTDVALSRIKPKVMVFENAPGLYTSKEGAEIEAILRQKSSEYGYTNSSYYTSTHLHGIPQIRRRTFFYFWKSKTAPKLLFGESPALPLKEFMKSKPRYIQDNILKDDLTTNEYFKYMNTVYDDFRSDMNRSGKKTLMQQLRHDNKLDEVKKFMNENHPNSKYSKFVNRVLNKIEMNKNFFDATPNYFGDDIMNGVVGTSVVQTIHPFEDRYLSIGDLLYLMGHPSDFELLNPIKNINHIAQNVPVCTAKYATSIAVKHILGELDTSNTTFNKYNNIAKCVDFEAPVIEEW